MSNQNFKTSLYSETSELEEEFKKALERTAVQPKSRSHSDSVYDQIKAIMGPRKARYNSVEAAVKEMQERAGLVAYLKVQSEQENHTKTAETEITVFSLCPQAKDTLTNILQATKGGLPLPALAARLRSFHKTDVDDARAWNQPALLEYLSKENHAAQNQYFHATPSSGLGVIDVSDEDMSPENFDPFASLEPNNGKP